MNKKIIKDLASARPDETKKLLKLLDDWTATTVKPLWGPGSTNTPKK
jgi:hypothetical protein